MQNVKLKAINTAVLYDIENIKDIKDLQSIVDLINNIVDGRPFFNAAYTDWSNPLMEQKRILLQSNGVIPYQVITHGGATHRNSADIALCVDAMELLFDPDILNFIIITGDGGFTSLITKIKKHKRRVEVISVSKAFSEMIRGFADEVHIISGQNIIKNDIKQTAKKDNNYISDEADKHYFKAIWAISKTSATPIQALKAIFKNYNVKKQLQESGIQIGIIENALKKSNDINHIKHLRSAIFSRVIKENDYKIIQTTSDNIIIIHESLMDADCFADAQEIIEVDSSGKYSKESAVNIKMDEITASNIKSYLLKRGVDISYRIDNQ